MSLFMRKLKKFMNKKKLSKGDKKFNTKSMTKRICYNYSKHDYFIANYPFERRDDDDDKKKNKFYKKDKGYKKNDKPYKKKSYGEAHISQEWDFNDESSNSDNDGIATVAIKGTTSSSKSLFSKLNQRKHTCLMAKESKRKVKIKGLSSPRYVTSDDDDASNDDAPLPIGMNKKSYYQKDREGIGSLRSTSWGLRGFAWAREANHLWAQETLETYEGEK
jgi:hypothetical protein